jgi:hypothetical protein
MEKKKLLQKFVQGFFRGLTTGAIDTFTKPAQGIFDLIDGTASAIKHSVGKKRKRLYFPEERLRLPRVCGDGSLIPYDGELAKSQLVFGQIFGKDNKERWVTAWGSDVILSLGIEPRVFDAFFGGCWAWICRLGKKMASRKFLEKSRKWELFLDPIFLSSQDKVVG